MSSSDDDELLRRWEQLATPEVLLLWSWFLDETLIRSARGELSTREGMGRRVQRLYRQNCAQQQPNILGARVHQILPYALWPGPHALPWGAYVAHELLTRPRDRSSEARPVLERVLARAATYTDIKPYAALHGAMWYELAENGWEDDNDRDELRLEEQRYSALLAGFAAFAAPWHEGEPAPAEKQMYSAFGAASYLLLEHS